MRDPRRAADLLRLVLPEPMFRKLDTTSLRVESGTYHDKALAETQSDILLSANYGGAHVLLYVLLEHKSYVDPWVPLQMLGYLVSIWNHEKNTKVQQRQSLNKQQTRKRKRAPSDDHPDPITLSPILPILISHAEGGWTGPLRFSHLFGASFDAHPELLQWLPDYELLIEDLHRRDDASLQEAALDPGVLMTLVSLRDAPRKDIADTLRRYIAELKALARLRDDLDLFSQLVTYLVAVAEHLPFDVLHGIIVEITAHPEDIVPTIAQQFHDKGRAEGRAEGEVAVLLRQITRKFGVPPTAVQDRLSAATPEQLQRWEARILDATSLEELFATEDGHKPRG